MLVAGEPAEGQRVGLFIVVWAHVFVDAFRIVIRGPVYELEIELISRDGVVDAVKGLVLKRWSVR